MHKFRLHVRLRQGVRAANEPNLPHIALCVTARVTSGQCASLIARLRVPPAATRQFGFCPRRSNSSAMTDVWNKLRAAASDKHPKTYAGYIEYGTAGFRTR